MGVECRTVSASFVDASSQAFLLQHSWRLSGVIGFIGLVAPHVARSLSWEAITAIVIPAAGGALERSS